MFSFHLTFLLQGRQQWLLAFLFLTGSKRGLPCVCPLALRLCRPKTGMHSATMLTSVAKFFFLESRRPRFSSRRVSSGDLFSVLILIVPEYIGFYEFWCTLRTSAAFVTSKLDPVLHQISGYSFCKIWFQKHEIRFSSFSTYFTAIVHSLPSIST